jgi:hypothetical protein
MSQRDTPSFFLIRNLIVAEVIAWVGFLLVALAANWVHVYRHYFPVLYRYVSFTVLEFLFLGIVQIVLIVLVVKRKDVVEFNIHDIVRKGEHEYLEFKTSFRWDIKKDQVNRELERSVMKTIAAFLNSAGGSLVIGLDDNGHAVGLASDMASLTKQSRDGFENHFNNVFVSMIGPEFRQFVKLSFHEMAGKDVCLVSVDRSGRPAYVRTDKGEDFFIRTGNATTPLRMSQVASYVSTQWR